MKFSIKEKPLVVATFANNTMIQVDFTTELQDLYAAYDSLTDEQKKMSEVIEVLGNISTAVIMINKYGQNSIQYLNEEHGLENLLQISEKSMTAQVVLEGLGNAIGSLVGTIVGYIAAAIAVLVKIFAWIFQLLDKCTGGIIGIFRIISSHLDGISDEFAKRAVELIPAMRAKRRAHEKAIEEAWRRYAWEQEYNRKHRYDGPYGKMATEGISETVGHYDDEGCVASVECVNWVHDQLIKYLNVVSEARDKTIKDVNLNNLASLDETQLQRLEERLKEINALHESMSKSLTEIDTHIQDDVDENATYYQRGYISKAVIKGIERTLRDMTKSLSDNSKKTQTLTNELNKLKSNVSKQIDQADPLAKRKASFINAYVKSAVGIAKSLAEACRRINTFCRMSANDLKWLADRVKPTNV